MLPDLGCLLFAAWTLLCNALVLLHGTSVHLAAATLLCALAAAALLVARRDRLQALVALVADPMTARLDPEHERQPWPLARMLAFGAGLLLVARFGARGDLNELSTLALLLVAASYATLARSGRGSLQAPQPKWQEALLWALGLTCAWLTLTSQRPDSDDAFYVNMAVSVVDFPHQALLSRDTIHGLNLPLRVPAYRASSIELLAGLLSYLSGLRTIYVAHLVLPAIAGLLTPLALARLLRLLEPRRWLFALLGALLYLVFDSSVHGSFGNFSFVRLFQGKAIFITTLAPLIMAHGIRFGLAPSRKTFAMLAATQIAALGSTVTAFWAAPVLAGLSVLCALAPRLSALRTLLLSALSSSYLLALGLYFEWTSQRSAPVTAAVSAATARAGAAAAGTAAAGAHSHALAPGELLEQGYAMVLGADRPLLAALAIVLCTWPLCRTPLARRFAVVFPLGFFALFGNPHLTHTVAMLTTPSIYWRVLWLLPLPVLFGLATSCLLQPGRGPQGLRLTLFGLVLCLFFVRVSPRTIFADDGFDWPRPKVDREAYRVAQALIAHLPPHRQVLAPLEVSVVLPMLNGYDYPLFVKPAYLPTGRRERSRRRLLTRLIAYPDLSAFAERWLISCLRLYHIEGVVAPVQGPSNRSLARALHAAGYRRVALSEGNAIWTHSAGAERGWRPQRGRSSLPARALGPRATRSREVM